jgi:hypothetical protein
VRGLYLAVPWGRRRLSKARSRNTIANAVQLKGPSIRRNDARTFHGPRLDFVRYTYDLGDDKLTKFSAAEWYLIQQVGAL